MSSEGLHPLENLCSCAF